MTWLFNGQPFDESLIKGHEGFVYLIRNELTGQKYLGRKYFASVRKVKGKTRRQRFESDWRDYWSSSDVVKEEVKKHSSRIK